MKKVILILILQMIAVFPQLKEFEIKETSTEGSTPVFVNYPDDAAIIIYSSIENIAFESNTDGIVNVKSESGKYTIVLKTERQYITLKCRGYREEKLSVQRMNAREVKYYSVEAKKTEEDKIPVTIITEPAGAQLFIDGVFAGVSSTQMLSPGVHEIRAVMDNYKPAVKTIEVSQKNVFFTIPLEKMKVVLLEIRSTPDKAKIFIEGIEEGETNDQLFKMPGRYNIKLTKSGYLDYTSVVDVKEGAANALNAVLEKSSVNLKINVDPSGAELKINKKISSAGQEIELAPGTYQIEIEKEGYDKLDDAVTLERGKPLTRNYKLMQQKGSLQVKVKPIDAEVELTLHGNEKIRFRGSAVKENIPVGNYEIKISADGYVPITKRIQILKNENTFEIYSLTENIKNDSLISQELQHKVISIVDDIEKINIYPNPALVPKNGNQKVWLSGITPDFKCKIYSLNGRMIKNVARKDVLEDGSITIDAEGAPVPSGVYIFILESGSQQKIIKVSLIVAKN